MNRDGLTANELVSSDEVRQLFRRIRFCSRTSWVDAYKTYNNKNKKLYASALITRFLLLKNMSELAKSIKIEYE